MSDTLTKAKLVEHLHARVGVSKKEASEIVEEVFSIMRNALSSGEKVKISGFGNFLIRDKSARRGRNPQTNEEIIIARRRVLTFKPSQVLRTVLNKAN
jgi:integration host factor subunit alpha